MTKTVGHEIRDIGAMRLAEEHRKSSVGSRAWGLIKNAVEIVVFFAALILFILALGMFA